jgi:hypothetical protein
VYIARQDPRHSWIVPLHGAPAEALEHEHMIDVIQKAAAPATLAEIRLVKEYEVYYLDRTGNRDGDHPLPVLFVRIAGEDDTGYYIDPSTAEIVGYRDPSGWFTRWLYHGLHSLNFPWLYNHRPAWDIVVLLLLAGGTTLCVTSAIIAWKLLQRKFTA